MEDTKRLADAESRDKSGLLTKFKHLNTELESMKERIEDEHQRKSDALKALSKAQAEIQLWRSRYETEGMGRLDDLETSRAKLLTRIAEAEETVESLTLKIANSEKSRARMQTELEDISLEYERTHAAAIISEKRGKNFDKVLPFHVFCTFRQSPTGTQLFMLLDSLKLLEVKKCRAFGGLIMLLIKRIKANH